MAVAVEVVEEDMVVAVEVEVVDTEAEDIEILYHELFQSCSVIAFIQHLVFTKNLKFMN